MFLTKLKLLVKSDVFLIKSLLPTEIRDLISSVVRRPLLLNSVSVWIGSHSLVLFWFSTMICSGSSLLDISVTFDLSTLIPSPQFLPSPEDKSYLIVYPSYLAKHSPYRLIKTTDMQHLHADIFSSQQYCTLRDQTNFHVADKLYAS